MLKKLHYPILFLVFVMAACVQNKTTDTDAANPTEEEKREIPFEVQIDDVKHYAKDETVLIPHDKAFPDPMTFQGFSLNQVIDSLVVGLEDIESLQATFICTDGYKPSIPLSEVAQHEGYITYQQTTEQLKVWADSIKERIPPYYVTWKTDSLNKDLINPYGVTSVRIEAIGYNFDKVLPAKVEEDSLLSQGFKLYEKMCMKCHAINQEGGVLGPELNVPQNITEYRDKEFLFAFIKNPASYRYNSKMPMIPLSDEKLELIYQYLEAMKEFKILDKNDEGI